MITMICEWMEPGDATTRLAFYDQILLISHWFCSGAINCPDSTELFWEHLILMQKPPNLQYIIILKWQLWSIDGSVGQLGNHLLKLLVSLEISCSSLWSTCGSVGQDSGQSGYQYLKSLARLGISFLNLWPLPLGRSWWKRLTGKI